MNNYLGKITAWDRIMMAITFAEAGDTTTACNLLAHKRPAARVARRMTKRPEIQL